MTFFSNIKCSFKSPWLRFLFYFWLVSFTLYAFYKGEIFRIFWYYFQKLTQITQ